MLLEKGTHHTRYSCQDFDKNAWSEDMPVSIVLAKLWNKYIPRGKGWFPRFIGRLFGKQLKTYIRTKHGAYLAIEPYSLDVYMHMLNHGRTWNEHVFDACKSFLSDGCVFYDIGANVGYVSIEMARIFEDKLSVISFEPQPSLARIITLSSRLNEFKNIKVFDLMLGDSEGEGELYVGSHSIHASSVTRQRGAACIKRKITTIDKMVETDLIPPPNVIKMDIEGGELAALSGAKKTIATYRPYIIFESDENMDRFGYTRKDVLNLIRAAGAYDFFFIRGVNEDYVPLEDVNVVLDYGDILAVPK